MEEEKPRGMDDPRVAQLQAELEQLRKDHAEALEAARESEKHYRQLQQALLVGRSFAFEWDPATDLVTRSREGAWILGLSEDGNGRNTAARHLHCVHPDDRARFSAMLLGLKPDANSYRIKYGYVRPGGSITILDEAGQGYFDAAGRMTKLVGIATDVTQREKAEERLQQSEEILKRSQAIAHLGSWQLDLSDQALSWSDETYRIFGMQPQSVRMTHKMFMERVFPDDREALEAAYWGSLRDNSNEYEIEHRIVRPTGEIRTVYEKCDHIRDATGRIIRSGGMVLDVTERRAVERSLRASEWRFRALFEGAGDGIFITDNTGRYVDVNARGAEMLGYSRGEVLGKGIADIVAEHERSRVFDTIVALREGLSGVAEWQFLRKNGSVFFGEVNSQALPDGRFMGILRDITERKRHEEQLRRTADELARSNRDLEQFAYVSSHDLQEPLRMVSAFAGLLRDRYQGRLDEKADQYIALAIVGAGRMQALIDGLLAYARVGKNENPRLLNAEEPLRAALANLKSMIEEAGVEVRVGPMPEVTGDVVQLTQVFQNLIANAVKFRGAAPPRIDISAARAGNGWQFSVRDNGIGLDPQYGAKIFEVFQRLHTQDQYNGTGIGLAICKKIVESHGGRIWVESRPGAGSTFHFTIT